MAEHAAELVIGNLPDKAACLAERGHARDRVGARTAADLDPRLHPCVECIGARRVDQLHAALGQPFGGEKFLVSTRNHVDDRIANGNNIKAWLGHAARLAAAPPKRKRRD